MRSRIVAVVSLVVLCAAAPPPKSKTVAPESFPHPVAMFLSNLSHEGKQRVAFKAAALGVRFFFEEPTGVTVYMFDGIGYKRQAFLKGSNLNQALAKYRVPQTKKPAPPKTKP